MGVQWVCNGCVMGVVCNGCAMMCHVQLIARHRLTSHRNMSMTLYTKQRGNLAVKMVRNHWEANMCVSILFFWKCWLRSDISPCVQVRAVGTCKAHSSMEVSRHMYLYTSVPMCI